MGVTTSTYKFGRDILKPITRPMSQETESSKSEGIEVCSPIVCKEPNPVSSHVSEPGRGFSPGEQNSDQQPGYNFMSELESKVPSYITASKMSFLQNV
jgi:hypothetical protein